MPEAQRADPRAYQVSQLRRRFTPLEERGENDASVLTFRLRPSDPDFPFDMDALHCSLRVPLEYPTSGKPSLRVTNPDMERGYQINIERGFDRIVEASPSSTLLAYFNALDKQLERLLSAEKAETVTVKIVSHTSPTPRPEGPESVPAPAPKASHVTPSQPHIAAPTVTPIKPAAPAPAPAPTAAQLSDARSVREAQVRQLEARMGRLPHFSKSSDGSTFTVPVEVRTRDQLPVELQAIKQIKLIVPQDYNISPCRIELVGVAGPAAETVERAFGKRAVAAKHLSLLHHVNYLSQNMHVLAKGEPQSLPERGRAAAGGAAGMVARLGSPAAAAALEEPPSSRAEPEKGDVDVDVPLPIRTVGVGELEERPHVVVIPRPPEWEGKDGDDDDAREEEDSSSESEDDDDNDDTEVDVDVPASTSISISTSSPSANNNASTPESGVALYFPHVELHGIELLEIGTLNLVVKCERCRDTKEVVGLRSCATTGATDVTEKDRKGAARGEACGKCGRGFAVGGFFFLLSISSV